MFMIIKMKKLLGLILVIWICFWYCTVNAKTQDDVEMSNEDSTNINTIWDTIKTPIKTKAERNTAKNNTENLLNSILEWINKAYETEKAEKEQGEEKKEEIQKEIQKLKEQRDNKIEKAKAIASKTKDRIDANYDYSSVDCTNVKEKKKESCDQKKKELGARCNELEEEIKKLQAIPDGEPINGITEHSTIYTNGSKVMGIHLDENSSPFVLLDAVADMSQQNDKYQETALNGVTSRGSNIPWWGRITGTLYWIKDHISPYIQWIVYVGLTLSVILLIYNGFLLVTNTVSGGWHDVAALKNRILYIGIGIMIMTGVYYLVDIVIAVVWFVMD